VTLVYATRDQLYAYTPERYKSRVPAEPEASRLLAEASKEVLLATRTAVYATDTAGYPTDTVVRQAFQDATCAQALWWLVPGNEGEEIGTSDDYQSVSIGSVTLSKKAGSGARQEGLPVGGTGRLCPKAATELAIAPGLTPGSVAPINPAWW
jgi:hypothetical protein